MTSLFKLFFIFIALITFTPSVSAAPEAIPIDHWRANNSASTQQIDHQPFTDLLQKYRYRGDDQIARFAYDKVSVSDQQKLSRYLEQLQAITVRDLSRDVQYAFWVNLYNSLTLKVILDHYPLTTIRDINISPGLFTSGPWDAKLVTIEGQKLSLNDIEHGILRPLWQDPRSHYVLNCASLGCPDLPAKALTPAMLDPFLEQAAKTFINHPRAIKVTQSGDVIVNSIYSWFAADFGTSDQNILTHIRRYAAAPLIEKLKGKIEIDDDHYAWQLNN